MGITVTGSRAGAYSSTISGIVIGWDMCGACHRHVSRCDCEGGPVEPGFLQAARADDDPPSVPPR